MTVDFTSQQSAEILTPNGYHETLVNIGLECTFAGYPASFDPQTGGEPGADPVFDVVSLSLIDDSGNSVEFVSFIIMRAILMATLGHDIYNSMVDAACEDAAENYNAG